MAVFIPLKLKSRVSFLCLSLSPYCLVHRYRNASLGFKFPLDSLVHSFNHTARDPDFSPLITGLDGDILKEVKMSLYQAINGCFLFMQLSTTHCTQGIFHGILSLLVLGSSHLAGSSQWTVMI